MILVRRFVAARIVAQSLDVNRFVRVLHRVQMMLRHIDVARKHRGLVVSIQLPEDRPARFYSGVLQPIAHGVLLGCRYELSDFNTKMQKMQKIGSPWKPIFK